MKTLPKTIYVRIDSEVICIESSLEAHARSGETRIVGVYQLKEKVEVATQMKEEIVTKKLSRKAPPVAIENTPPEIPLQQPVGDHPNLPDVGN